ncbi:twin-arginine translocation signal domain-containing protein [Rudanella paleaurantiibacter]|uniref:Twin-arginine translocation signal domain-containing protein n=1 Tax=Rudanella paleaurantiibacter TaxID=2614655 RepID=A0A7J5TX15_9BACT|nr:twin-arginine translocation signal domain-containing protein [Rudanella paleaurantiibacter]KAB7729117.1 twin-arginine translocation signal domain-containing protein [Rudanella paleaurantiibacter]
MNTNRLDRRDFLQKAALATLAGVTLPVLAPAKHIRTADNVVLGHNSHRYRVVPNWGVLDAGKNPVNDCHEMVEDAKGRIFLLTNETKNNILIYDKSGKLLDSWGTTYPGAHGLTILNEGGEQFLLISDNARRQVIKTDLKGREIMKIDYPRETGVYAHAGEFTPTETAVNPANGDIYVADGYGANYITQYDAKGRYIRHFGGKSNDAAVNDKFDCCHGVLVDTRNKANPTLLVTDRRHQCFKRFTLDGKYLSTIPMPGTYICRPVLHGDYIFGAAYRSTSDQYPNSGYVQILDKNDKVVSTPGGTAPIYQNGKLQEQQKDRSFMGLMHPHDVHVDNDENLYVAQWSSQKTYPIKLERIG